MILIKTNALPNELFVQTNKQNRIEPTIQAFIMQKLVL